MAVSSGNMSAFAADAVRYATDSLGNGAYFLPDSDGQGDDLNVPGNLTVGGTSVLTGLVTMGTSPLTNAASIVGNLDVAGSLDVLRGVNVDLGLTVNSGNFSVVTGLTTLQETSVTGTLAATLSVTSQDALICGSTASPGGQIKGYNGTAFIAPTFPLGMIGGQNATWYMQNQATGTIPAPQGPPITWDGSPISIQLNYSLAANQITYYNIVIPTSLFSLANSGKLIAYGQLFLSNGEGVVINFWASAYTPGGFSPVLQFGMNPASPGGPLRAFQAIYEYGNAAYFSNALVHANSWTVYNSD